MKKMRHMKRKALVALVLSVTMLLTLMPGLVFGVSDDQGDPDTVSSSIDYPTVNFTDVAPFLPPVSGAAPRRSPARAAGDANTGSDNGNNGMAVNKTSVYNKDTGAYDITLEAFAIGSKVITEQKTDIPTDIVLVIDQSGSMEDPIGGYTYTAYRGWFDSRNYYNEEYYPLRHNGGSENLWYKLNNNEYIAVSVEQKMESSDISGWNNRKYYDNQNSLYCLVSGEYKSVTVKREGHLFSADEYWYTVDGQQILYTTGDDSIPNFGQYAPLYQSVKKYIYSYTLNGATTVIEESIGDGSSPNTQFYRRDYSSSAGGTRLNALKNAATTFASAVATKAAGEDGDITTTADNVNHRIAVVGYADTDWDYGYNTGVFIGSTLNRYENNAARVYGTALQDMSTTNGKSNVAASLDALQASGATRTDYGLTMANGILNANPVPTGETRNRVVIVFTDGSPTNSNGFQRAVANRAISTANAIKAGGTTVYSIGIFPGADASSAGTEPSENLGDNSSRLTAACNWFMQKVSSNNGTPRTPSYYLSAGDSASLNNIFQQISNQIETGGAETTLGSETVVKDIISPYFTLPAGTTASGIRIDTYACTGKDGNTYTWSGTSGGPGGATATVDGDQVSVTGFDFSENWCGTETDAQGNSTVRGNKLVISFEVSPKSGFLGGNEVITNASAGIYENGSAQTPVMTFEQPKVNVPIQDVTVTATDKNVYLKGEVTADQLKDGSEISVGDVKLDLSKATDTDKPYGLDPWQTEYVDITVTVKDKDGNVISDKLENLTEDTTYTVEVTVAPKTVGTSTPANGDAATAKTGANDPAANIYVFKPELTFKDSSAYYGESVPTNNDYSSNKVGLETWKHGDTASTDAGVTMLGTKPTLDISYTPDESKLESGKYTKQDVPVAATVKIGTENVNEHTTFVHQDCTTACGWETPATPGAPAFLIHIQTCTLNITKQGGAADESYVFDVFKDGVKYSEVTVWGNGTETLVELPIGTYTISENTGWSWRYSANNGGSAALTAQNPTGSIACTNTKNNNQWLNGFSEVVRNIFGTNH